MKNRRKHSLTDGFGRQLTYLRLSVTDRCNLKCMYCHPPHRIHYYDKKDICSYAELLEIVRTGTELGIEKVRLTGGEVFVRADIIEFIRSLSRLEKIKEVALTTNGTLLLPYLGALKETGLKRINISLDTLSEDRYYRLTGTRFFSTVLESILKAVDMGFDVKVNMVVLRGLNEAEIPGFIEFFLSRSVKVRFIEFMPLCGQGWREDNFFPHDKIKDMIERDFTLEPVPTDSVGENFLLSNGGGLKGSVGIIAPLSRSFCSSCSRLRLSARGELRPCLFSSIKVDILPALRTISSLEDRREFIRRAFLAAVEKKPEQLSVNDAKEKVLIKSLGG